MPNDPVNGIDPACKESVFSPMTRKQNLLVFLLLFFFFLIPEISLAEQAGVTQQDLFSASFPTEQQGWVCGRWGTVLHTGDGGLSWKKQESGTDYTLLSICFTDPQTGWAVGDGGTIIHTEDGGQSWIKQNCPNDYYLMGVCFVDNQKGWIATEWTTILHTEDGGKNWEVQFSEADYILKSVSFCDPLNGWAAGEYGYIYHTTDGGKTWEHQAGFFGLSDAVFELVGENTLFNLFAVDPMTAWAVGIDGYVTKTIDGGKTWEQVKGNFPAIQLFGVTSDKQGKIVISGNRTLRISSDGGNTFVTPEIKPSIEYGWVYGVAPRGSKGFVAVGKDGWIYFSDSTGMSWERARSQKAVEIGMSK